MQILVWETYSTWDYNPRPMSAEEANVWLNHFSEMNPGITYRVLTQRHFYQWLISKTDKTEATKIYYEVFQ